MPAGEAGSTYRYTFTVFTPTYNRAGTLPRVYQSLQAQTFRDFEWLVIDDGSTDDTRSLMEAWQREAEFPLRYIYQENQGKHVAFNRAAREAQGELLVNLDSDDRCLPRALERLRDHWESIPGRKRAAFSSVVVHCVDPEGRLIGDKFPRDVTDSDPLEIRYRFHVRGEKWGFQRTDVLRQYPFPETIAGSHVPEDVVWGKIARSYKTRFVNEALRVYYADRPSLVHGPRSAVNAAAGRLQHLTALNEHIDYFRYAPWEFCRFAVHYARFSFHLGTTLYQQFGGLDNLLARALWALFWPIGWIAYRRDRR